MQEGGSVGDVSFDVDADIDYPMIGEWLQGLDSHPIRGRDKRNFSTYAWQFDNEGFRRIDELINVTAENLKEWFGMDRGTAMKVVQYVATDVKRLRAGATN